MHPGHVLQMLGGSVIAGGCYEAGVDFFPMLFIVFGIALCANGAAIAHRRN